jgi:exonuclease SbcC
MILELDYVVTFPTTGITLRGNFQPQSGITAVVGPNESGKTFGTIELTRYLLYGKKAFRGAASDYKSLDAKGRFRIHGKEYSIKRSSKREEIVDANSVVLAVGAEAVTGKVIELMGYNLDVFDVCNASVQKKAHLFGELLPSARKRLIDQVVGLTSNEKVEKACREEAQGLRREVDALARVLHLPDEPVKPKGYRPSIDIRMEYDRAKDLFNQAQQLARQMRPVPAYTPPSKPRPANLPELVQHEADRHDLDIRRSMLEKTTAKRPTISVPYSHLDLNAARDRLAMQSVMAKSVTCPHCSKNFVPGHEEAHLPDGPDLTMTQIQNYERELRLEQEAAVADDELAKLGTMADRSKELEDAKNWSALWMTYEEDLRRAEWQRNLNIEIEKGLRELGLIHSETELNKMESDLMDARIYESGMTSYAAAEAAYNKAAAEVAEKERLAGEYKKGAEALSDARATLKAYMAPRLSTVASSLIADMTHGKHTTVSVDDEMEITVDGQRIETLSGGAETVANLALRLALGQILVASAFPVFLGDEMDSDADDVRREAVIEAMASLKSKLSQIILVTHRTVEIADHVYDLKNT